MSLFLVSPLERSEVGRRRANGSPKRFLRRSDGLKQAISVRHTLDVLAQVADKVVDERRDLTLRIGWRRAGQLLQ